MKDQAKLAIAFFPETKQTTVSPSSVSTVASSGNIFNSIVSSKTISQTDKTVDRMSQEGIVLITAGGETTSRALATATYHILANRGTILPLLQQELGGVMPNPNTRVPLNELESLPMLVCQ